MTEPLVVDPDGLDAAGRILRQAAGNIPVKLPELSVPGTDPLSLAIAQRAVQVEAPMAALSEIRTEATTVAENVRIAGQRYAETDRTLAEKARQHRFATEPGSQGGSEGQGGEKFDWIPDGQERGFMAAGAVADGTTDAVRQAAVKAMKEGPTTGAGKASPALTKFLDDVKIAGKTFKGVSGAGGVVSALMVVPNAVADMGKGDSWRKAFGKNTGGALAGVGAAALTGAAFGSAVPVVGTVAGLVVGGVVGYLATEGLDTYWEPMADAVGGAVEGVKSAASTVGDAVGGAMRGVASVFSFG